MKKNYLIVFLQVILVLIGIGVFAFLLWEPHLEGVNAHATNFEIYFKDPFLAFVYAGSIPFFVALRMMYKVLQYIGKNMAFTPEVLQVVRVIRYCALTIIGFVVVAEILIMLNASDDRAGGIFMGALIVLISMVVFAVVEIFERVWQSRVTNITR